MSGETPSSPERKLQRQLWRIFNTYRDFMETQPVVPDEVYRQAPNEPVFYDEHGNVVQPREITKHVVTRKLNIHKIGAYLVPGHFDFEEGENRLPEMLVTLHANDGIEWTYGFRHVRGAGLDADLGLYLANESAKGNPLMPDAQLLQRLQTASGNTDLDMDIVMSARNAKQLLHYFEDEGYVPMTQDDIEILEKAFKLLKSHH